MDVARRCRGDRWISRAEAATVGRSRPSISCRNPLRSGWAISATIFFFFPCLVFFLSYVCTSVCVGLVFFVSSAKRTRRDPLTLRRQSVFVQLTGINDVFRMLHNKSTVERFFSSFFGNAKQKMPIVSSSIV